MVIRNRRISLDTQYQVIAGEYTSALNGVQTVIVINLAISIGVLAAMMTIINLVNTFLIAVIGFSVLAFVGLLGAICSIRTIHIAREQIIDIQKQLVEFEKRYCYKMVHKCEYYKPLHITLCVFWTFAVTFMVILAISLLKLLLPNLINFAGVLITIIILFLGMLWIVKLSDRFHKYKEMELLSKKVSKNGSLDSKTITSIIKR